MPPERPGEATALRLAGLGRQRAGPASVDTERGFHNELSGVLHHGAKPCLAGGIRGLEGAGGTECLRDAGKGSGGILRSGERIEERIKRWRMIARFEA